MYNCYKLYHGQFTFTKLRSVIKKITQSNILNSPTAAANNITLL